MFRFARPRVIPNLAVLERTLTPRHQNIALMARNKQVARRSSTKPAAEAPPGYAIDPSLGPMLQFQRSLPHLPVPTLSSTASKYLETVRPHLTANEYKDTQEAVDDFVTSPLAAELQERLKARASQPGTVNWLADWWNDVAYMGYRDPVVVFVSYFYVHVDGNTKSQARRAAELIKAMLPFRHLVETCVQTTFLAFGISLMMPRSDNNLLRKRSKDFPSAWIRTNGCQSTPLRPLFDPDSPLI